MSEKTLPVPKADAEQSIDVDPHGDLQYGSAAASGHTALVLPSLPGSPNGEERLLAKDFGAFVAGKIESAMSRQGYLRSGPTQNAVQVFRHYLGAAKGSGLMDSGAIGRMETLAKEFEKEPEQGEYFSRVLRPWLLSLSPGKR